MRKHSRASVLIGIYTVILMALVCASIIISVKVANIYEEKGLKEGKVEGVELSLSLIKEIADGNQGYAQVIGKDYVAECFVIGSNSSKEIVGVIGGLIK